MIPVVRVLIGRAAARRESLLALADVVPADYWSRTAPGESWSAQRHLVHALSAEDALEGLLERINEGSGPLALEAGDLYAEREAAIEAAADLELASLIEQSVRARERTVRLLAALTPASIERMLVVVMPPGAWPAQSVLVAYAYLEQWAAHDAGHEAAIRDAISTPPDLSAVAHVRRIR